jgi:hypothetical protein
MRSRFHRRVSTTGQGRLMRRGLAQAEGNLWSECHETTYPANPPRWPAVRRQHKEMGTTDRRARYLPNDELQVSVVAFLASRTEGHRGLAFEVRHGETEKRQGHGLRSHRPGAQPTIRRFTQHRTALAGGGAQGPGCKTCRCKVSTPYWSEPLRR